MPADADVPAQTAAPQTAAPESRKPAEPRRSGRRGSGCARGACRARRARGSGRRAGPRRRDARERSGSRAGRAGAGLRARRLRSRPGARLGAGRSRAHRAAAPCAAPRSQTLLHVAVDRGISHAKLALRPVELGGIEIRLQATAGGIAAQVVADSPEAARLLAQAGDDLRRALEARDVNLISLEVSTSGDQQQRNARGEWTDGDDAVFGRSGRPGSGDAEGDAEPAPTTQTVIELPGGLLVDVLA